MTELKYQFITATPSFIWNQSSVCTKEDLWRQHSILWFLTSVTHMLDITKFITTLVAVVEWALSFTEPGVKVNGDTEVMGYLTISTNISCHMVSAAIKHVADNSTPLKLWVNTNVDNTAYHPIMVEGHKFLAVMLWASRIINQLKMQFLPISAALDIPNWVIPSEFHQGLWHQKTRVGYLKVLSVWHV